MPSSRHPQVPLFTPAVALLFLAATSASAQAPVQPPAELSFLNDLVKLRKEILFDLWEEVHFPPDHEIGPTQRSSCELRGGRKRSVWFRRLASSF